MVTDNHYRWDFIQLSTDVKPTPATSPKVADGSTLYTSDDSKLYIWYKDQWYEKTATGSGGSSYTAGDGIDITNDVISATNTGQVRELTTDDYNYPANNPTTVALWLMPAGLYKHANGVSVYATASVELPYQAIGMVGASTSTGTPIFIIRQQYDSGGYFVVHYYTVYDANGSYNHEGYIGEPYNKLDSYSSAYPLSANQGRVLNEKIGDLSTLTTTDKTSAVAAINELAQGGGGGVTPVQTTGTSTTDVMSQDATTKLIYPDIANSHKITIGASVSASSNQSNAVSINANVGANCNSSVAIAGASNNKAAIGTFGNAYAGIAIGHANVFQGSYGVAIGDNATSYYSGSGESGNVAIGSHAQASDGGNTKSSVALGYYSMTNRTGEVNVGGLYGNGYNSTDYRVIGGVHDGQLAHDAVTVSQVNATIDAINNALSTSIPHIGT